MFANKPIIGIVGGIGSGKTFIAKLFGELGGLVISSDEQVSQVYRDPAVQAELRRWWGDDIVGPDGSINRRAIAAKIFNQERERTRLEALIHPLVHAAREQAMSAAANSPDVTAFIWDTPLLFEAGLDQECDAVVYVETPVSQRLARVSQTRGWDAAELTRRENSQWALDRKREISDYVIRNTADVGFARGQVRDVFTQILTQRD